MDYIEKIKTYLRFKKKYKYAFAIAALYFTGDYQGWWQVITVEYNERLLAHDWFGMLGDLAAVAGVLAFLAFSDWLVVRKIFPVAGKLQDRLKV